MQLSCTISEFYRSLANCKRHLCVVPIPVAVRSNAWVYSRLTAGIADSNPAEGMDVHPLCLLCVV